MEKVRYMISDAAGLVHVEAHVLRYWEEELELSIPRNEMGHRYYTRENIRQFQRIRELKEQGYQLKEIRAIIHNGEEPVGDPEPHWNEVSERTSTVKPEVKAISAEERMARFRELMSDIVGHAISLNNEELSQLIGKEVEERVLKEMNYLMREQDEAAQERARQLDAAIRGHLRGKKIAQVKKPDRVQERRMRKEQQRQEKIRKRTEKKMEKKNTKQVKTA